MQPKQVYGLGGAGKAYFVLAQAPASGAIIVVADEDELPWWRDNLSALGRFFSDTVVCPFPAADKFARLYSLAVISVAPRAIILASPESLASKTLSPESLQRQTIRFEAGRSCHLQEITGALARNGYAREEFVEEEGHFSRRGEILDIWAVGQPSPWRIVFNYDTVESIRRFDVTTQRSEEFISAATVLPADEIAETTLYGYLPPETPLFVDVDTSLVPDLHLYNSLTAHTPLEHGNDAFDAGFRPFIRWAGNFPLFLDEYRKFSGRGFTTVIFCANRGEQERLEDLFAENRWHGNIPEMVIGTLQDGFFSETEKRAFFAAQEILYRRRPVHFPQSKTGRRLEGLWEISSGDYVVHDKYGIGRYRGLKRIMRQEQEAEYLAVEYKGGDKLYVPLDDFRIVKKYVGLEGKRPRLYSLDTAGWEKAKKRAKESAEKLAKELLVLYAARQKTPGWQYPQQTLWEKELADSFSYTETEDQRHAIEEVMSDLEQPRPMERLVCGDVGFGKTEVAVRAAFKVAVNARQVAVLVPTTVLAEQHFQTFTNRLSPFPVRVAMLSRFQSKLEQKKVVTDMVAGNVDIVIGTHRLLQKDISFKDLGLLIVDEEHRFGVKQKEKIKSLKKNVDILMLSATPIPRTLSFAMARLRDLSVIETPPVGRLPIETHLGPYDEKVVKKIIEAELSRGGQVFYVHNRVETIFARAQYLMSLVSGIRWGVVHGQMSGHEIEKTMWKFSHREIDVLIATTIIESGLDIPSVNTMVIEDAENFGLAQLYQLRGRIGREKQKAYCYLFYTAKGITDEAEARLTALQEFSELGSGFRLALRDLEIRGAGNILGAEQHGFVREIGFDLYSRLIDDAARKIKGAASAPEEEPVTADFLLPAYIPDTYIEPEDVRIVFYRRLAVASGEAEIAVVRDELSDRFGALPEPVCNLLEIASLRSLARSAGVRRMDEGESYVSIFFAASVEFKPEAIACLAREYSGQMEFMRGEAAGIRFNKSILGLPLFDFLKGFLLYFSENVAD